LLKVIEKLKKLIFVKKTWRLLDLRDLVKKQTHSWLSKIEIGGEVDIFRV